MILNRRYRELEALKSQFSARMQSFADATKNLEKNSSSSVEELKKAHKAEVQ